MTPTRIAIAAALAAALAVPVAVQAQGNMEKCYGVAKAGKNDCQTGAFLVRRHLQEGPRRRTPGSPCPRAACEKIVGGKLTSS